MLIKKTKKLYKNISDYRYHISHKKNALYILNNIEKDTKFKLSSRNKKKIKEYSKEKFGSTLFAYWLFVYTAYNQEFKEGWIPDNYFGGVVAHKINNNIGQISDVKTLTKKLSQSRLLPDTMYKINNNFYDEDFNYLENDNIKKYLFANGSNKYFLKKDNSSQGRGILKIDYNNFDLEYLKSLDNFVVQRSIKQHTWFNEIVKGSVATIRVTTVRKNKNIKTRASFLRVGRSDSKFVKATTLLRIPIINNTGELGEFASDPDWIRHYKHPDTGFVFAGEKIPGYFNAIKKLEAIHQNIPHFTIIGWDITINKDGLPEIIEWNAEFPDIKFTEASIGPSFKDLGWEQLKNK